MEHVTYFLYSAQRKLRSNKAAVVGTKFICEVNSEVKLAEARRMITLNQTQLLFLPKLKRDEEC
jgi:hypothetical protein